MCVRVRVCTVDSKEREASNYKRLASVIRTRT